ncbi:unnamed protein product, partial [Rotaria magnacalcarata]
RIMYRGKKSTKGAVSNHGRGRSIVISRPITRKLSATLSVGYGSEDDRNFALIELTLNKKLFVVGYEDLIKSDEREQIKIGTQILVKQKGEPLVEGIVFCIGSKQQCLDELDLVRRLRDNKENLNSNGNIGASTTASSTVSTQGKITTANSDRIILETTVSDSVSDIIPIHSDLLNSSSTISSRTTQMSSSGLQISNHSLNTISVESLVQPSVDPRILTPSSSAAPKAKAASNLQTFHTNPLIDLAEKLTEMVKDRDKWKSKCTILQKRYDELESVSILIPTDDNVCEWICTLYDTIHRQTNLQVDFDQEASMLGIPSVVLKMCVHLSKPPTTTARQLFQQVCHQELAEYKSWSGIPSIKMDAIHSLGERLFGHIRWDRKTIKTSLQNWIRAERAIIKRSQQNDFQDEQSVKNGILENTTVLQDSNKPQKHQYSN